jgi:predicted nucleotidyltransferase
MNLEEIRSDLASVREYEVLVFGSILTQEWREASDVDIVVLSHLCDENAIKTMKRKLLGKIPPRYDITIFESLPIIIKASVLQNYEIVYGDPLEIGEYLRRYWKEWQDYEHRLELPSLEEMREGVSQ